MPFLSFLSFFALYAGAAFPSFGTDEGAELLAAAAAGGVPPPPAQTLAWLLAKVSLWVPFGAPAYRTNLLAAALMAGTVPLVAGLLERLSPPKSWAPFADQELEQERWRATARWLTAFLWGLSPGPWRCALSLGPDTTGLFLVVLAFRAAVAPAAASFPWGTFLAALAAGQWPAALAALPGISLMRPKNAAPPAPLFSPRWGRRTLLHAAAAALGLLPALAVILLSRSAPLLDAGSPDTWGRWLRYAMTRPPFFPPSPALSIEGSWRPLLASLGAVYTLPGAVLCLFGFWRLARGRLSLFHASLLAAAVPGPLLFLWARPAPDPSSPAQAAAWGLCALGLAVPFLWGYHRAGVRFPAARAALALLLPLSLAGRLPLAARTDTARKTRAENVLDALPEGALLWDPAAPGAVFHARFVEGRRMDVRVARRPDAPWAHAEYRRRHPPPGGPALIPLSADAFFLDAARDAGPEKVFTDLGGRLPRVDSATGLAVGGDDPEDLLPSGAAGQFLPAQSHRLAAPAAQLSLDRLPLWASRTGDAEGAALMRMALSRKEDQYGLSRDAEEEALSSLADDPGQPDANRRLGESALDKGDAPRAAVYFRRALARAPRRAGLWSALARAARAAGNRAEAVDAACAALALDPSSEDTRRSLAEALGEENLWRPAADQWRALMDLRPEERVYAWRLAKAEAAAGRPDKARAALREYLMFPLDDKEKDAAESFEKSLAAGR